MQIASVGAVCAFYALKYTVKICSNKCHEKEKRARLGILCEITFAVRIETRLNRAIFVDIIERGICNFNKLIFRNECDLCAFIMYVGKINTVFYKKKKKNALVKKKLRRQ